MKTHTINPVEHMITEIKSKTLQAVHLLRQVNFSEAQAEVIADLIEQKNAEIIQVAEQKIEINEDKRAKNLELLATKVDLLVVKKELELKIEQVRSEMQQIRAELLVKIEQTKSDLIRWTAGAMIAQTGVLFTLIKIFA